MSLEIIDRLLPDKITRIGEQPCREVSAALQFWRVEDNLFGSPSEMELAVITWEGLEEHWDKIEQRINKLESADIHGVRKPTKWQHEGETGIFLLPCKGTPIPGVEEFKENELVKIGIQLAQICGELAEKEICHEAIVMDALFWDAGKQQVSLEGAPWAILVSASEGACMPYDLSLAEPPEWIGKIRAGTPESDQYALGMALAYVAAGKRSAKQFAEKRTGEDKGAYDTALGELRQNLAGRGCPPVLHGSIPALLDLDRKSREKGVVDILEYADGLIWKDRVMKTLKVAAGFAVLIILAWILLPPDINVPPDMNPIPPQSVFVNSPPQKVELSGITAGRDKAGREEKQKLKVTATSNNKKLIPDPEVNYTSGSTGSLTFLLQPKEFGDAVITITVMDDKGAEFRKKFTITVKKKNDPVLDIIWADVISKIKKRIKGPLPASATFFGEVASAIGSLESPAEKKLAGKRRDWLKKWHLYYRTNYGLRTWLGPDTDEQVKREIENKVRLVFEDPVKNHPDELKRYLRGINEAVKLWRKWAEEPIKFRDFKQKNELLLIAVSGFPAGFPEGRSLFLRWCNEMENLKGAKVQFLQGTCTHSTKYLKREIHLYCGKAALLKNKEKHTWTQGEGKKHYDYEEKLAPIAIDWKPGDEIRFILERDSNFNPLGDIDLIDQKQDGPVPLWRLRVREIFQRPDEKTTITLKVTGCPGPPNSLSKTDTSIIEEQVSH